MDLQALWSGVKAVDFSGGGRFLEISPGYLPIISIGDSSYFTGIDDRSMGRLKEVGGAVLMASAEDLPYRSGAFDLVCAFHVLEHIREDKKAFGEIHRVLRGGGIFILAVPLFKEYWSLFDELAGHECRYHPLDLQVILEGTGFEVERFWCPRNLLSFIIESRLLRPLVVGLRLFLASVEGKMPNLLPVLYKLFALSPLDRLRGVDSVLWEDGYLGEIENHCEIVIVCRKA